MELNLERNIYMGFSDFTPDELWALAQICKRITYGDIKTLAKDEDEAVTMAQAISRLKGLLAEFGYSPR